MKTAQLELVINLVPRVGVNYQCYEPSPWKPAERYEWMVQLANNRENVGIACTVCVRRSNVRQTYYAA